MPRSIVGWFAVCWSLFLIGAVAVGVMLIALYKETTTQRTARAAAGLARACEALGREGARADGSLGDQSELVARALRTFPGVEGGLWSVDFGPVGYAFPSYEGSGRKTDLPQAEEPSIRAVAEAAHSAPHPVEFRRETRSQTLLITGCAVPASASLTAWAMTRVVTVGGRPFLLATSGLALLLLLLLGSAALLGRVLWRWSQRLRMIETALASGTEDLPQLPPTGQRDLDRVVAAINGAGAKAVEARQRSARLAARVAMGERLAALGRVAAGVAHEIRNPISAMRLKAETALAHADDPARARSALQVVLDQIARMDQLLQDLLRSVQRSEVKRQAVTQIRAFLAARAALFEEQAGARVIRLEGVETLDPPTAFDPAQIGGALDNLILNAIQNSEDGTPIVLTARLNGGQLHLAVADYGTGVPDRLHDHLFEPFATGRPDGTGLGLAIVREVAEAHGGGVSLERRRDGSTFTLVLPKAEPPCPPS